MFEHEIEHFKDIIKLNEDKLKELEYTMKKSGKDNIINEYVAKFVEIQILNMRMENIEIIKRINYIVIGTHCETWFNIIGKVCTCIVIVDLIIQIGKRIT